MWTRLARFLNKQETAIGRIKPTAWSSVQDKAISVYLFGRINLTAWLTGPAL